MNNLVNKLTLSGLDSSDKRALCSKILNAFLRKGNCTPSNRMVFEDMYEDAGVDSILRDLVETYKEMGYELEYSRDEVYGLYQDIMT